MNEAAKAKTIVELEWEIDHLQQQIAWRDELLGRVEPVFDALKAYTEGECNMGEVFDKHARVFDAYDEFINPKEGQ